MARLCRDVALERNGGSNMKMHYETYASPIGELLLVASELGLREIRFERENEAHQLDDNWIAGGSGTHEAIAQLESYFAGDLTKFDLLLDAQGTDFMKSVWIELCHIPFGETISYGELAKRIGNPSASRAVGMANGRNPIPIVVPCHRVIGSNGRLTGFAGGLPLKERLLLHESKNQERQSTLFAAKNTS
ncbi:MAG: methylated-DNA-[protein]-cysteine S-methyltransferase [Planctomycetota bacterium]|jgi:methylated-DNA-[protein]-cysteine S-methyltransferase